MLESIGIAEIVAGASALITAVLWFEGRFKQQHKEREGLKDRIIAIETKQQMILDRGAQAHADNLEQYQMIGELRQSVTRVQTILEERPHNQRRTDG